MELAAFVDRVVGQLKETPVDLALLGPKVGKGSIHNGGAGVALFLHELARLRGESDVLPLARRWCEAARAFATQAEPSEWFDSPSGFTMGESGLSYVEALVSARQGDREGAVAEVERIDRLCLPRDPASGVAKSTEYLGGAAGIVCLARDLDARLPPGAEYEASRALLAGVRERALGVVLARYEAPIAPGPGDYLGFAHGIAGELWALVGALGADHPVVRSRLGELAALRETDEEGLVYWLPWAGSDATQLLGTWCNGMAGHTLLWCEVARQTRSAEWAELARQCAESVVILVNDEVSICCGHAGHALALHRYADLSGDAGVRQEADERLTSAAELAEGRGAGIALGLWQGTLGVALAAMERLCGEREVACIEPGRRG